MNKQIRVLIVDDEEQFTLNLARILVSRDFDVTTAFSGFKAVDTVRDEDDFDVIILDVKMPGMDGVATLKEIKKLSPDTEVIMLTGHATLDSGIQAIREGAYDYLMKPCDIEDLAEKIREAYGVESIKRHPVLWPRNKVEEIIQFSFKKLAPEDPLVRALDLFGQESGETTAETLFILDSEDRLQGLVSKRDLIDEAQKAHPELSLTWTGLSQHPEWLPRKRLIEIMRPETMTTYPEESLTDAAFRMIKSNIRSIPVVKEGKTVGIVRMRDIFQYIEHEIE